MHPKKFDFFEKENIKKLNLVNEFLKDGNMDGCVIGGNSVSANYVNKVYGITKNINYKLIQNLSKYLRPTADIDIVVIGEPNDFFYSNIRNYFGSESEIEMIGEEIDVFDLTKRSPYLSFYFTSYSENNNSINSVFYENVVKNSRNINISSKENKMHLDCAFSENLDTLLMKLISFPHRNSEKKQNDLRDIKLLNPIIDFLDLETLGIDLEQRGLATEMQKKDISKSLTFYNSYLSNNMI